MKLLAPGVAIALAQEAQPPLVTMLRLAPANDRPITRAQRGKQRRSPWRLSSWRVCDHRPRFASKPGWVLSGAWICDFPSQQTTSANSRES
ncbi:hypothetical protein SAMN05444172_9023 [Burkholderia sp. GAS332]|nr:hypothetical protein SAMN05444172_9023 [Burkholderia sp. GAS332]